jgi:hypothetical protein
LPGSTAGAGAVSLIAAGEEEFCAGDEGTSMAIAASARTVIFKISYSFRNINDFLCEALSSAKSMIALTEWNDDIKPRESQVP